MMIGMALQLEQEEITDPVTGIPGMPGIDPFVLAGRSLSPDDTVMLDVIY